MDAETRTQARLEREARERLLGRLGEGINVARVEVSWYSWEEPGQIAEQAGYFLVAATGDEPDGIYARFEELVCEAMDARMEREGWDGWQIDDLYAT